MEEELDNGLIVGHAYSVTDVKTVHVCTKYILQLKSLSSDRCLVASVIM